MDWDTKILAWGQLPEPVGTIYTEEELGDPERVRELLDHCQVMFATISGEGWDYLLQTYGLEGLYRVSQGSGAFDCSGAEEFSRWVEYMRASSPPELT